MTKTVELTRAVRGLSHFVELASPLWTGAGLVRKARGSDKRVSFSGEPITLDGPCGPDRGLCARLVQWNARVSQLALFAFQSTCRSCRSPEEGPGWLFSVLPDSRTADRMKWVSRQECRGGAICASRIPICTCSRRCLRLPRQADRSAILREQRRCSWTARSPTRSWALSARRWPRTGSSTSLSDKIWSRSCTKSNRLGCCAHGNLHLYCQSATAWAGLSLTRWLTASTGSAAWSETSCARTRAS